MEQSSGDQSPAKFAYPFIQPPEVFHAPRLGIIHFLAWMAVNAVLLGFFLKADVFNSPQLKNSPEFYQFFCIAYTIVYGTLSAFALVCACVIAKSRWRGIGGRLQAGHWLIVSATVTLLHQFAPI